MLDSVHFTDQGFASTTDLRHAGIFLLVWPDGTHNEIMADCETEIIIKIEQTYPFKVSIQGNVVAEGYEVYLETLRKITTARDSIGKLIDITADNDKKSDMRKEQTLLDKELDYQITFMAERYKGTLLGNYLRSVQNIRIPDISVPAGTNKTDSFRWRSSLHYYQQNYLKNLVLDDPGLIYTPVLEDKLQNYLSNIIEQNPKSITGRIDEFLVRPMHADVYRFTLEMLLKYYASSIQNPIREYIFLHLIQKYYLQGKAEWASNEEIRTLSGFLSRKFPTSLYQKAPEIRLPSRTGKIVDLYGHNTGYTLLLFWDYSCDHCIRVLDDLKTLLSGYPEVDMMVYSVFTGDDLSIWKGYIDRKVPESWINVQVTDGSTVLNDYNVERLPALFLLNSNMVIIDKAFTVNKFETFLNYTRRK